MEGASWESSISKRTEYNNFIENVFRPLYKMSSQEDCLQNENYKKLLKECEFFDPYRFSNMWESYEVAKNKLILMVLEYDGYYYNSYMRNIKMTDDVLITKLRFILNLLKFTNIDFDKKRALTYISYYLPSDSDNDKVIELIQEIEDILKY